MADFEAEFRRLIVLEGEYSDNPDDAGGETIYGISRRAHPDWEGWYQVDMDRDDADFPDSSLNSAYVLDSAEELYRKEYWDPISGYHLSQALAAELFESSVNLGLHRVVRYTQRALNALRGDLEPIIEDGIFGKGTLKRLEEVMDSHKLAEEALLVALNSAQCEHYVKLAHGSHKQRSFIIGWLTKRGR